MAAYRVVKNGLGTIEVQEYVGDYLGKTNYWQTTASEGIESLEHAKELIQGYIEFDKEEELRNKFEVLYEVNSND